MKIYIIRIKTNGFMHYTMMRSVTYFYVEMLCKLTFFVKTIESETITSVKYERKRERERESI